jgi:hypothetical protein
MLLKTSSCVGAAAEEEEEARSQEPEARSQKERPSTFWLLAPGFWLHFV